VLSVDEIYLVTEKLKSNRLLLALATLLNTDKQRLSFADQAY